MYHKHLKWYKLQMFFVANIANICNKIVSFTQLQTVNQMIVVLNP